MLFNSYIFIFLFLPLALLGWYGLNRFKLHKVSQVFLAAMSLWFYAYFEIRYLLIIVASCVVNYLFSLCVTKLDCKRKLYRRILLIAGCTLNLGILGYFKYYDFILENLNGAFGTEFALKNILLPLGISFFTFQQLSFVIDRCRGTAPHYGFLEYINFVTFFPQLIAGPIVLHSEIIPQFRDLEKRRLNAKNFADGIVYFVIGLGKKVLLADTLAIIVNFGFGRIPWLDTTSAIVVALAFTFELYFDFSGYCDMAIGIGKMFNIDIPDNFNSPYKSKSVKEFWRRWHMTLGRFFTTYVYIPLGGSRQGKIKMVINTMIVFLLSGLWHGANWTFVLWGLLHGIAVAVNGLFAGKKEKIFAGKTLTYIRAFLSRVVTFMYVCLTFVFFRSDSVADGIQFMKEIFRFESHGDIVLVARKLELAETYIVTKLLSMRAPQYLDWVYLGSLWFLILISFIIIMRKRTGDIVDNCRYNGGFCLKLSLIFVWSVISLSGVSTFLYFNF